jgi:hypothetical protein
MGKKDLHARPDLLGGVDSCRQSPTPAIAGQRFICR